MRRGTRIGLAVAGLVVAAGAITGTAIAATGGDHAPPTSGPGAKVPVTTKTLVSDTANPTKTLVPDTANPTGTKYPDTTNPTKTLVPDTINPTGTKYPDPAATPSPTKSTAR